MLLYWKETQQSWHSYVSQNLAAEMERHQNIYRQLTFMCLLGQGLIWQSLDSFNSPTQSSPPCCGAGLVQVRSRSCVPSPHDFEHVENGVQLVRPPSIGHSLILHWRWLLLGPSQSLPPWRGAGSVQFLSLVWMPLPHDSEHGVNAPQEVYTPSTEKII